MFLNNELNKSVQVEVHYPVDSMLAYSAKQDEITLVISTSNPFSAHSSILMYTFEDPKLTPVKQELPIPTSEAHGCSIRSRLSSPSPHSNRLLALSFGGTASIIMVNLDKNISR